MSSAGTERRQMGPKCPASQRLPAVRRGVNFGTFLDTQHSPGLEGNACHGPGHVPLQLLISQLTFIFPSSKSHIPPPHTPPTITESNEIQMGQRKALDVDCPLPETTPIGSS